MRTYIFEITQFLKTGDSKKNVENQSICKSVVGTTYILILSYISTIIIAILVLFVLSYFGIKVYKNNDLEHFREKGVGYLFFTVIIIGPIIEEMVYRIGLVYSSLNITLMMTFVFYLFSAMLFDNPYNLSNTIFRIILSISIGSVVYLLLNYYDEKKNIIKCIWSKYSKFIFYISAIVFGVLHIVNYSINTNILIIIPLITLPQILMGILLGYVRLKYGIFYSISMHIVENTITVLISINS